MPDGAFAPDTLAAADMNSGIAALKNGSSKLEPPIAGLMLAAASDDENVKSPLSVAEAPAAVTATVEIRLIVAIATPTLARKVFFILNFPPKESESRTAKRHGRQHAARDPFATDEPTKPR